MQKWKILTVTDIAKNINQLNLSKMYRSGAIIENANYEALEIEDNGETVRVLSKLERGFEIYISFKKCDYNAIADLNLELA